MPRVSMGRPGNAVEEAALTILLKLPFLAVYGTAAPLPKSVAKLQA